MDIKQELAMFAELDEEQELFLEVVADSARAAGLEVMPVEMRNMHVLRAAPDASPVTRRDVEQGRWVRLFDLWTPIEGVRTGWGIYTVDVSAVRGCVWRAVCV